MRIDLTQHYPIADIQENMVFANNGNLILCCRADLPEIHSLSEKDFEDLHGSWFQALKSLPAGTVVHKQDIYRKSPYTAEQLPNCVRAIPCHVLSYDHCARPGAQVGCPGLKIIMIDTSLGTHETAMFAGIPIRLGTEF